MPLQANDDFTRFIAQRKKDLLGIARATRREYELADVIGEIWLIAHDLAEKENITADFSAENFQKQILSHAYQRLVRYTERNVRHAVRLDHFGDADRKDSPLDNLMLDGGAHTLSRWIDAEDASEKNARVQADHSSAGAYLWLLRRFDRMQSVADYLLISASYAYRCCAKARMRVTYQRTIPLPFLRGDRIARPWRRFRATRIPLQLEFDFDERLALVPCVDGASATMLS